MTTMQQVLGWPHTMWQGWRRLREFHAYHGPWALGVKLLRRWSIRTKVLLLLGVITLPLGPLALNLLVDQMREVQRSGQQLLAVQLADAAAQLSAELDAQAHAALRGRMTDVDRLSDQHQRLALLVAELRGDGHALPQAWTSAERVVQRATHERGLTPAARRELTAAAQVALEALRTSEPVTRPLAQGDAPAVNQMASLAVSEVPDLVNHVGRIQALTDRGEGADALPPATAHETLIELAGRAMLTAHMVDTTEVSLGQIRGTQGAARVLVRTRELVVVLRQQLQSAQGLADASPIAAAAAEARKELTVLRATLIEDTTHQLTGTLQVTRDRRAWILALLVTCLALAVYLGYSFFLVMRGGLDALHAQMNRMAEGDLSARPEPRGDDEVALTLRAMSTSLTRLSDLLASVRHGVGAVTQAARQVALGNGDLTERNRASAERLDGVVSAVVRYTRQLEACGREVETVVATVQELRLDAVRNRKQTLRLQEQMGSLRTRSREIADIVRLIDAIAFRTNILALNAQVEASKAGESGRGFAVVAQEVRSLALRSADSARRIDQIVSRSTEDIERSGAIADETSRALATVDEHVDRIHAAMQGVAELTRNGEVESTNILSEVRQLQDRSARDQQLVDDLAKAADSLRAQGVRLGHSIAQFTLA